MAKLSEKVGLDFQIQVIKTCSTNLPDIINWNDVDWTNNPEYKAYKVCAEKLVSTKTGIAPEKLQECSESVG